MENHAKESIKHKVVLPNSKTINIEGTNFKYEIHYDQLNDKDLLMIEKYANYIFHAYQERYGLDMNTDHTVKGFIYNNLTDLRNAHLKYDVAHASASFHHCHYSSNGSIAYNLTSAIESTLTFYNQQKRGIPYPEGRYTFLTDVAKELKAIRLDDNQGESNTAEKPETTINQEEPKRTEPSGSVEEEKSKVEEEKSKVEEKKSGQEEISTEKHQTINQEESNTAEKPETTIHQEKQEEPKRTEPSGSEEDEKIKLDEEKSRQEEISTEKHKVVLPHSKTINIEGTNFKYEIHYDQLNDKDLLTIEKYANYIFHAYQERYGLDMNTDHTVKGFIYNNLTDLRNACPEYNAGYATAAFHHYSHKSWSLAHNLTAAIYFTLSLYNKEKHGIPPNENYFIRNMAKELKAIRLDDNQEESNTAEKPETTINQKEQEESKKVESSGSGEEEKIKVEEAKSSQEEISTEKHQTINQEESNTAEKPETTINQEEPKRTEPSGSVEDEKSKVEEKKSGQEEISTEKHQTINQEESNTAEKSETTINQEEPKRTEPSGSVEDEKIKLDEAKSSQEEVSPETVLPYSKTINIEGTNFKYEIHYDQLNDKDLLTIEKGNVQKSVSNRKKVIN